MEDEKYFKEVIENIKDRLDKHDLAIDGVEGEIELLKLSNVEVKTKLSNIELSQEQIKNMINETSRDNQKITMQLLDTLKEDKGTNNKIKVQDRKEIWGIVGAIVAGLLAWLGLK